MPFEFDLDVRELDEYRQRLEAAGGTVGVAARGVVQNYSNKVSIEAKRLAPVDTGRLRDSIEPDRRSEGS